MDNPIHERQKGVSQMIHIYSKLMSIMEGNYYELWTKWTIKKKGALKMIHIEKKLMSTKFLTFMDHNFQIVTT